jgi:sortase A
MESKQIVRKSLPLVVLVLLATSGAIIWFVANRKPSTPQVFGPAPVVTISTDKPEEKLPNEVGYSWQGQINDPKQISIDRIGVDSLIQNVGVDQNKAIAVPNNIHIAGWFVDSVRPGEMGLSIIDGHVNGPTVNGGVFGRLNELAVGDSVNIVLGDDTSINYKVHSTQELPTDKTAEALFSQIPSITRQLNLVTCTGEYDKDNQTYKNRLLVVLEQVD